MAAFPRPYGRYLLDERIAMGGMAEIFRARTATEGFEKRVCIKRILPHFLEDETFVSMFRDEARTAAKLQHANIVQVFDFGEAEGTLYLAMELVDGSDLRRLTDASRKKGLELLIGEVLQIGIDACRGLHHAHALLEDGRPLHIVHRDVSPHNILISRAGEVKITDFGIARAAERSTHTSTGIVKGKVAYMSPEQAEGGLFDHRLDQWALGVVLWEALCGERLFRGDNDAVILKKILDHEVVAPSTVRRDVPPALDEIILRALAAQPKDRFSDLRQMELALSRVVFSGVIDPTTADLRNLYARVIDAVSGPMRRTNIFAASEVISGSEPAVAREPVHATESLLSAGDPGQADAVDTESGGGVSQVFTVSDKHSAVPAAGVKSNAALRDAVKSSGANPVAPAAPTLLGEPGLQEAAQRAFSAAQAAARTQSGPRAAAPDSDVQAGDLSGESARLSAAAAASDEDGPATRTLVPASRPPASILETERVLRAPGPDANDTVPGRDPLMPKKGLLPFAAAVGLVVVVGVAALVREGQADPAPATQPGAPTVMAAADLQTAEPARIPTSSPDRVPAPVAAAASDNAPTAPVKAAAAETAAVETAPDDAADRASAFAKKRGATGMLFVEPPSGWVRVWKGKKLLGTTPLRYDLPIGTHWITLVQPQTKAQKTVKVVMPAGGKVRITDMP